MQKAILLPFWWGNIVLDWRIGFLRSYAQTLRATREVGKAWPGYIWNGRSGVWPSPFHLHFQFSHWKGSEIIFILMRYHEDSTQELMVRGLMRKVEGIIKSCYFRKKQALATSRHTYTRFFFFYQVFFLFALPFRRLCWLLLKASQHNSSGPSTKESHTSEKAIETDGPPTPTPDPENQLSRLSPLHFPFLCPQWGEVGCNLLQIMWHGAHGSGREKSVSTKAWNLGWGKFRKERERKWQPACGRLKEESSDHSPGAKC